MPASLRALALLLCLLAVGCGTLPADSDEPAITAGAPCAPRENPPQQAGSHLIGDARPPVPYSSTPPTSGWHSSGALEVSVHGEDDPLTEPDQVSILEAEGVVITHNGLAAADRAALEAYAAGEHAGRVATTPYPELPEGTYALAAWGVVQRCGALEPETVEAFLDDHLGDEVTPGH